MRRQTADKGQADEMQILHEIWPKGIRQRCKLLQKTLLTSGLCGCKATLNLPSATLPVHLLILRVRTYTIKFFCWQYPLLAPLVRCPQMV